MKNIFILFILVSLSSVFYAQNTIGVQISVGAPSMGTKKVTVSYVANGAFVAVNGSDDWGNQVITLGWKPSSGLLAAFPSSQITGFTSNNAFLPFVGNFTGTASIGSFTLSQIGGSNDGNVYTSFVVNAATVDRPLSNGSVTEIFSFFIPSDLGTTDNTELFLLETQPPAVASNLTPTVLNSFYGSGSSIWNGIGFSTALPIYNTMFSVVKHTNRSSKLNWKTSSEINSDFFEIERIYEGSFDWEVIGRVAAAGNSSIELAYEFIDDKLPLIRSKEQLFYYRLRMTDLDGQYKYSDVRGVNFGKLSEGVVTIYPNPTVEHINVDLSGMDLDAGAVDLFVYDMSGRQMIKKSIIGNGIELIDVSLLPASTYNVVVKQGETAYQQRVIKID